MKTLNKKYLILSMFCFGMLTACTKPNSSEEIQNNSFTSNSNNSTIINLSNEITSDVYGTSSSSSSSANTNFEGWDVDLSLRGTAFRDKLATLINQKGKKTCSYDACLSTGAHAAEVNNSGQFVPFYHSVQETNKFGSVSKPSNTCNREHTWPNSRGAGKSGPGADPKTVIEVISSMVLMEKTIENGTLQVADSKVLEANLLELFSMQQLDTLVDLINLD